VEAKIILDEILTIEVPTDRQCSTLFVLNVALRARYLLSPMAEKRYFVVSVLKIMVVVPERLALGNLDGHRCSEQPVISVVKIVMFLSDQPMVSRFCAVSVLQIPSLTFLGPTIEKTPDTLFSVKTIVPNWKKLTPS